LIFAAFCLVNALPGEDSFADIVRKIKSEGAKLPKPDERRLRRQGEEACPNHPKPLPQEIINKDYAPAILREAFDQVKVATQKLAQKLSVQSVSVGMVYDQELVWNYNLGSVVPNDPTTAVTADTPYRAGSITKAFTNLMLMKLRDAGKVTLDDPVSKLVPDFKVKNPYPNSPGITWRSLASQNSGLQGSIPCNYFSILEPVLDDGCDITNEEAWRRLSEEDVMGPMYTKPHYADSAYAIIGRALESILDGKTYEQYMLEDVFKPLGIKAFFDYAAHSNEVPQGFGGNNTVPSYVAQASLNWAAPTGQLYGSVNDMQKFVSLFFQGETNTPNKINVYSSSLREMLQPVSINDDGVSAYGFPWEIIYSTAANIPSRYWLITKTGRMPGYSGAIFLLPELKLGYIVLTNNNDPISFAIAALAALVPALEKTLITYALPPPAPPSGIKIYDGVYIATALLGTLSANVTITSNPDSNVLNVLFTFATIGLPPTMLNGTWVQGDTFRMHLIQEAACLDLQAGWNDVFIYFQRSSWTGDIYSLTAPGVDPFYGWTFYKQTSWWPRKKNVHNK